jgi:hypothetical protein
MTKQEIIEKILRRTRRQGDCLFWIGGGSKGYGLISYKGSTHQVHRLLYKLTVSDLPHGIVLDHLCRNRACLNIKHLEPVTHRENLLRGEGIPAINAKKTHCKNGHEFSKENIVMGFSKNGVPWRRCRACKRGNYIPRTRTIVCEKCNTNLAVWSKNYCGSVKNKTGCAYEVRMEKARRYEKEKHKREKLALSTA